MSNQVSVNVIFIYRFSLSRFSFFFFPAEETKTPPPRQVLSLAFQPLKSAPGNTPNKVPREKTPHVPACSSTMLQPVSVETFSGLRLRSAAQHWPLPGEAVLKWWDWMHFCDVLIAPVVSGGLGLKQSHSTACLLITFDFYFYSFLMKVSNFIITAFPAISSTVGTNKVWLGPSSADFVSHPEPSGPFTIPILSVATRGLWTLTVPSSPETMLNF